MRRYYLKNLNPIGIFAVSNILAAVSSVLIAFLLGSFADVAISGNYEKVWKLAVTTFVYIFADAFFDFLLDYTRKKAVYKIGGDLRADLVEKIERLPYEAKKEKDDGYYLSMINNDVETIEEEYLDSLGAVYFQICCFIISVTSALLIQPVMTMAVLLISALPVLFPKLTEKALQSSKEEEQSAKASYLTAVNQILSGYFILKVFGKFKEINAVHERENENLREKKTKFAKMNDAIYSGAYGCGNLVFLGTWVLGLFFVLKGSITLPLLITFSQLMTFVAGPVQIISERYALTVAASAVCKRIVEFINAPTDEELGFGNIPLEKVERVEILNLCYSAGEKEILHNVNLDLHRGDRVALLGESGSGKSTLMKVLSAMCEGSGEYRINGKPAKAYFYEDFRKQVALLEQKSFVFTASIKDNVTLFEDEADDEKVLSAVSSSGLEKWFKSRGNSPKAIIDEEKQALSGGEERRLDLARIIYHNAGFVMLDEPTAGLDSETRNIVEKTIETLDCDILITAMHSYSEEFLKSFNRIIHVKDGKVWEESK